MQSLMHASEQWCASMPSLAWRDGVCHVASHAHGCAAPPPDGPEAHGARCSRQRKGEGGSPCIKRGYSSAQGASVPALFNIDIGVWTPWRTQKSEAPPSVVQCCEVCASFEACSHWLVFERSAHELAKYKPGARAPGMRGTLGKCVLYGAVSNPPPPFSKASGRTGGRLEPSLIPAAPLPVVLLRSDAQKLEMVTRCHEGYFHWWRKTLAGEATLELLVDVSALTSSTSASSSSASSTSGFDAAAHEQLTRRAAATFRRTLGLGAFAYTVEQVHAAFPAVTHWPSPETHNSRRRTLSGNDSLRTWWTNVLKKYKEALGPSVAARLTSYLIHEPSLVLWARARAQAAGPSGTAGTSFGSAWWRTVGLPSHVWVIEDDTVFLGDVRRFFAAFRHPPLLSAEHSPPQQLPDYISTFANLEGAVEAASHDWKRNEGFEGAYGSRRVHK